MIARIRVAMVILALAGPMLAQDYESLGRNLVEDLFARRFEKVASQFNERWAQEMPAAKLPEYLDMLLRIGGSFQNITGVRSEGSQEWHVVYVACRFERTTLHLTVSFDSKGRVAVLTASPADPLQPPFDEKADAKGDIRKAIDSAGIDGIRVLITWGANDDGGSRLFLDSKANQAISTPGFFRNEYKTVNVNVGHIDKNIDLAKSYGAKLKAGSLPALTVLDAAGDVLANTNADELRHDKDPAGIDAVKVAAFLKSHQAPAPNAVALFEAALNQSRKEHKIVFVWFSAPW